MKLLTQKDVIQQGIKLGELRHMVRDVRNEFNFRIMDGSPDDMNVANAKNMISADKMTSSEFRKGKLYTNKPIEYMKKDEAIKAYNEYVRLINQDTTTEVYRQKVRQSDIDALKRFNKARRKSGQTTLTMQQFQEFSNIYDKYYDLFEGEYYRDIINSIKSIRKKYKGKKSLMDYINDAEKESKSEGTQASKKEIFDRAMEMSMLDEKTMKEGK